MTKEAKDFYITLLIQHLMDLKEEISDLEHQVNDLKRKKKGN